MKPYVSVIVPVYNDSERLKSCLTGLEEQTYSKEHYEVIVVDNGSDERPDGVVRKFSQAVLIYENGIGSYRARNRGIAVAKGDIIAFTDSDCIPAHNWIEKGVMNIRREVNCGLVGGKIEVFFKDPEHPTAVELYQSITGFPQKRYVEVDKYGATANLFTFRSVIDAVGLFNAELKSGGDVEWGHRVFASGYKLIYAEDTCVAHPARRSLTELYKMFSRVTEGHLQLRQMPYDRLPVTGKSHANSGCHPFNRALEVCKNKRLVGFTQKSKVLFVMVMVRCFGSIEKIRLAVGGRPKR
jgi:glycosyltransferase involved in cell wall biosynthesis